MSRVVAIVAIMLVGSLAIGQDRGGGAGGGAKAQDKKPAPCDVKTTEQVKWCEQCAKILEKDEVQGDKCKQDGKTIKKIELCVKKYYACACPGGKCCKDESAAPGKCSCKKPMGEKLDKCKVLWICEGCENQALVKDELKHDDEKHKDPAKKKDVKKSCEKSGTGWHTTK